MLSKTQSVVLRFVKGFIAAGLSSALVAINQGSTISSVSDLKKFGFAVGIAFLTGVMLAVQKSLSWKE